MRKVARTAQSIQVQTNEESMRAERDTEEIYKKKLFMCVLDDDLKRSQASGEP